MTNHRRSSSPPPGFVMGMRCFVGMCLLAVLYRSMQSSLELVYELGKCKGQQQEQEQHLNQVRAAASSHNGTESLSVAVVSRDEVNASGSGMTNVSRGAAAERQKIVSSRTATRLSPSKNGTICLFTEPDYQGTYACMDPKVQAGLILTPDAFPELFLAEDSCCTFQSIQLPPIDGVQAVDAFGDAALMQTNKTRFQQSTPVLQPPLRIHALTIVAALPQQQQKQPPLSRLDRLQRDQKLDVNDTLELMQHARDPVDDFVTSKAALEEFWGHGALPWATNVSLNATRQLDLESSKVRARRVLYFISPTHFNATKPAQWVDFTRLKQTLQLASLLHHQLIYWIVTEDNAHCTWRIRHLLVESGLPFAHVAVPTVPGKDAKNGHRGVQQRNAGLELVERLNVEGVVYFGDDDNAYDTQLFTELPYTRQASLFGVGFAARAAYERCQVNATTQQVVQIHSNWASRRKYPMDMAGFAFSTAALLNVKKKKHRFSEKWRSGYLETYFLDRIVSGWEDFDALAADCLRILTWHTATARATLGIVPSDDQNQTIGKGKNKRKNVAGQHHLVTELL